MTRLWFDDRDGVDFPRLDFSAMLSSWIYSRPPFLRRRFVIGSFSEPISVLSG